MQDEYVFRISKHIATISCSVGLNAEIWENGEVRNHGGPLHVNFHTFQDNRCSICVGLQYLQDPRLSVSGCVQLLLDTRLAMWWYF